ncbi:hypothetical protein Pmani_038662 [Petrolisthes manimaculis]|uniref:Uncharacterized protein n=1 Tax=Petrolisthes manimaculis TaxID=1843537 RepID=A0AAE1NGG8_9EUCA|nr:hypothetical protein Pmani_038662 [Petrolisthes manimaculis]
MCKTCRRPVSYEEEATVGPWGLSEAYKSASLAFRRLRPKNHREEGEDSDTSSEERSPVKSTGNCVQTSDTNNPQGSPVRAIVNTHGGAPLAHTNRASRTYHTVGVGDGNGVIEEEDENSRSSSANSIITDSGRDVGSGRQHEIAQGTKDSSKYGRKIGQVTIPLTGDGKLESTQQTPSRPFFFLPSEDEDEGSATYADTIEQELLKDPDLYPFPKTGGGVLPGHHQDQTSTSTTTTSTATSTTTATATTSTTTSPSTRPSKSPTSSSPNKSPPQKTGEETDEIRNRIRYCLQRARSRSASLCGLGSFEAGLYRLEKILDENKDSSGHQSLPPPTTGQPRAEHAAVLMNKKYKDAGTITETPHV